MRVEYGKNKRNFAAVVWVCLVLLPRLPGGGWLAGACANGTDRGKIFSLFEAKFRYEAKNMYEKRKSGCASERKAEIK